MRLRPRLPPPLRRVRNRLHIATRGRRELAVDTIAWISNARSGSTYVCELLHSHPQIAAHTEIFHRKCVFTHNFAPISRLLADRYGVSFPQPRDAALVRFIHEAPARFLSDLRELAGGRVLSFKIFPGHLDQPEFRRVVLADRNIAKVLFRRDPLATFISREKALQRKQWEFADTSGQRIHADPERFHAHVLSLQRWYASARHYLEDTGQPYWETSYEELMQIPGDDARRRWIIEQLADTFPAFRILDPSAGAQEMLRHRKQDASRVLEDKLSNYEDFCRGLIERGLEHHLPTEAAR